MTWFWVVLVWVTTFGASFLGSWIGNGGWAAWRANRRYAREARETMRARGWE